MRQRFSPARLLSCTSLVAVVAMSLGGCTAVSKLSDVTGSTGPRAESAPADPARAVETYGERYRANPKDADAALGYGQALRANGQRAQAVAVLEQATIANPGNKALLAQYGRALADNGNFQQSFDVLSKAHSPDNPDWRLLSVQGTALDQMGRHEEARSYYASALKIAPGDPGVLSNVGLSYMLSKDLPKAEEALRQAYAAPGASARVRQNLGLVVGLQGRFAEAETIVKADLPPDQAAANVAYLKDMLSRSDGGRGAPKRTPVASLSQPG
ncbi:tetratricopeptide repeat protein [Bradyrhizobium diazoefficiens]|nr:tetratricopeptide repeat protein [Bradyrhizobium diazoefficiens]MBR0967396.1 tetratricopeptide repeat protein [Bradyrhizobium diazoefficiens]MBR0980721.1 tetratricopeptide repeat protein [Bradyrhizobium diazoefficiens]MBR1010267.1 tetratricopeptide repeat protein [Bradyrhizobium diazoefficiens]MBR1016854.1 tetratricopeptide repeat protein [Bradyrhizobium diazoefficiens]MBR1054013.1 tetratricopeptide repeat protein [Bradyrhizobium diazoefficiens]